MRIVQKSLLHWYQTNGRHSLPWRDKRLPNRPYAVLLSEIMLQQTQVKVVKERYFFQFLEKFPTLKDLSKASEQEVLRAWQGLGYYTRARNLHKLAQLCANTGLPKEVKDLIKLPGIGTYTAGAIACFAYDLSVSFVDSNIKRILTRLFALKNPTQKQLEQQANALLNLQDSFNHNQALLDLGALICTAKSPKCGICPLEKFCKGKNMLEKLTKSKTRGNIKKTLHYAIFTKAHKIALVKSTQKLYFNLYNFPEVLKKDSIKLQNIGILKHSYTKYNLSVHCYFCDNPTILTQNLEFFTPRELSTIPLSALALKILKLLNTKGILNSNF
ncbi:A/G-specific adenine glycosylase [Helicobacter sp.]|uniref:A/G-specific adenine glycosylase n=1 Tax=Helicobacter sp. TaxID=218 RepID=UPI0025C6FEC2|nr:A/G-specific adenine glycosylase [Helicobacter sp.]MCI5968872.1 A/G-specific adenine glycosylase [Helicobacter sp.]MDY2584992.1 A/G-specific adenine glycosylase [Helicobacter sp.]